MDIADLVRALSLATPCCLAAIGALGSPRPLEDGSISP